LNSANKTMYKPNLNIIGKSQLADALNISSRTLSRLLNVIEYPELKKLRYRKSQRILYKHQLDYLFPNGINFN